MPHRASIDQEDRISIRRLDLPDDLVQHELLGLLVVGREGGGEWGVEVAGGDLHEDDIGRDEEVDGAGAGDAGGDDTVDLLSGGALVEESGLGDGELLGGFGVCVVPRITESLATVRRRRG